MSIPLARLSDKGTGKCTRHNSTRNITGFIIKGSSNVIINGLPAARLTDKIVASCGHVAVIIKGSSKTLTNGLPTARLGDKFISGSVTKGTIIGSSPNVNG